MAADLCGDLIGLSRQVSTTPGNVEIGPQQEVGKAIHLLGRFDAGGAHYIDRYMSGLERGYERLRLCRHLSQAEQCKAVALDPIVDGKLAGFYPDVRQPRAGPAGRDVLGVVRLRTAGLVENNGRVDVPVPKLRAEDAKGLGRFQLRNVEETRQCRLRLRRIAVNAR